MVQPTANAQQTFCRSCDKIVEESEKIIYKKCKHVFHQACVELNKKKVQGSCNNQRTAK